MRERASARDRNEEADERKRTKWRAKKGKMEPDYPILLFCSTPFRKRFVTLHMPWGFAPSDRGFASSDRGFAPSDRGFAPSDRGFAPSDRGFEPSDRGFAPSDRGFAHVSPNIHWAPPPPPPPPSLPGCAVRTKHSPPSALAMMFKKF